MRRVCVGSCRRIVTRPRPLRDVAAASTWRNLMSAQPPVVVSLGRPCVGSRAFFFTNTETMKKDDPYAQLGLTWGATTSEIKDAYKKQARALHPDVNTTDTPEVALKKFQELSRAYSVLTQNRGLPNDDEAMEEWSFAVWRKGDVIAQERTDVAGLARKRPVQPATSQNNKNWGIAALGHPNGGGNKFRRAEYLGDGDDAKKGPRSSTVGTGRNKWVKPKEFKPWNPKETKRKEMEQTTSEAATQESAKAQ